MAVLRLLAGWRRAGLTALAVAMNRWLHAQGAADGRHPGMACTFSGLVLRGRRAHLLHVGDLRIHQARARVGCPAHHRPHAG
ncbi:MAG: hypothetical protein U1E17_03365 [Geminicoccaceae bacterium]